MQLKTEHNIVGRGKIVTISLKENGLDNHPSTVQGLLGTLLTINEQEYKVIGVECTKTLTTTPLVVDTVGLLIKPT